MGQIHDMAAWRAAHCRPISWYGVFYAWHRANYRIAYAIGSFWRDAFLPR